MGIPRPLPEETSMNMPHCKTIAEAIATIAISPNQVEILKQDKEMRKYNLALDVQIVYADFGIFLEYRSGPTSPKPGHFFSRNEMDLIVSEVNKPVTPARRVLISKEWMEKMAHLE